MSDDQLRLRSERVFRVLGECYPTARAELDFTNPFELLIATILSAQSTDRRVNTVTPVLFAAYPDAASLALADPSAVEEIIRPAGFFRTKTEAIIQTSARLVAEFGGQVPASLDDLVTLPGVGRKTANVVLGNAFGVPGLTPDTHFMRVSRRLGWTKAKTPDAIEADVAALFAPKDWIQLSHRLIWHGRRRCHARHPACGACPVAADCPSFGEGETDPAKAASLVRQQRR